ncbi:hypothetical protein CQW23_30537 [Capsicum baccatum]|uniref:RNA exonuclease 4 n=1 Tax=Capsicum baccatum TaxID=33114 RepID=A0A2G2VA68_CAPBA|nr:hypothetical protein CQW23_30537 [Capsicum baccatum]
MIQGDGEIEKDVSKCIGVGPLPKADCEKVFKERGCDICLTILASRNALRAHRESCQLSRSNNGLIYRMARLGIQDDLRIENSHGRVVALSCKMVGGGSDGSLDLCARVCLIDQHERILFHSYVAPNLPITNYRYETTGIRQEHLRDAVPLKQVSKKIQDYLCNGEPLWQIRSRSGRARILVGHSLDHDLKCLELEYPTIMIRDTAKYPPLMKTSKLSNSLKYLTKAYLGYEIQTGIQDPYEDCVATMRLYMRMKSQAHRREDYPLANDPQNRNNFGAWRQKLNTNHDSEQVQPDLWTATADAKDYIEKLYNHYADLFDLAIPTNITPTVAPHPPEEPSFSKRPAHSGFSDSFYDLNCWISVDERTYTSTYREELKYYLRTAQEDRRRRINTLD